MDFKKDEYKTQALFKRYCNNKDFVCYSYKEKYPDGNFKLASVKVVSKYNKEYTITEYFKDNLTDYVIFAKEDKEYRFNNYIEAEISLVDALSAEV
jgi:hypothetical protein